MKPALLWLLIMSTPNGPDSVIALYPDHETCIAVAEIIESQLATGYIYCEHEIPE